jgi:hypothetical protein
MYPKAVLYRFRSIIPDCWLFVLITKFTKSVVPMKLMGGLVPALPLRLHCAFTADKDINIMKKLRRFFFIKSRVKGL